jgi:hypothetical protein
VEYQEINPRFKEHLTTHDEPDSPRNGSADDDKKAMRKVSKAHQSSVLLFGDHSQPPTAEATQPRVDCCSIIPKTLAPLNAATGKSQLSLPTFQQKLQ